MKLPIQYAPAPKCVRELDPGEVKRTLGRSYLVGYNIACPGCGWRAIYLHEEVGFIEEPADPKVFPKALVGIERPPPCMKCGGLIGAEPGFLTCSPPAVAP